MKPFAVLILGYFCLLSPLAQADTIRIAVASNFTSAMKDIAAAFEKTSEHKVSISLGSSGKFYSQIRNGAPYQVFFSADQAKPMALEKDGMVAEGSRFTYAVGALALWSADADRVDPQGAVLSNGDFSKLAIANPKLAPYGQAALETMAALNVSEKLEGKLVRGENISQAYQFVLTGNAPLGFIALSQVMVNGEISKGSAWQVPSDLHNPIRQDAVLLKSAENSTAVQSFLNFVRSDEAKAIIQRYGYKTE